jgi:hypothetical protein
MNWLILGWWLTFGVVPQQQEVVKNTIVSTDCKKLATVCEIGLQADIMDHFVLRGSMENYQYKADSMYFDPYRIDYKFSAGCRFNDNISLWFDHECDHPVLWSNKESYSYYGKESKLYIRFDGCSKY